jgi:hypothetical protein
MVPQNDYYMYMYYMTLSWQAEKAKNSIESNVLRYCDGDDWIEHSMLEGSLTRFFLSSH